MCLFATLQSVLIKQEVNFGIDFYGKESDTAGHTSNFYKSTLYRTHEIKSVLLR